MADRPPITPEMKVAAFLDFYPELEERLLQVSPRFALLRQPALRKTMARAASLRQAAAVAEIPIDKLMAALGAAVDEPPMSDAPAGSEREQPPAGEEMRTLDVRSMIARGEQPLGFVLGELNKLEAGGRLCVITPFPPVPLIDAAKKKGLRALEEKAGEGEFRTMFIK